MRALGAALLLAACAGGPVAAGAQDLSAETLALVHDLMAPYRGPVRPALGPDADPAAVSQALQILGKENLLDFPAPPPRPAGIAEALGRALAMGQRTRDFLPEIGLVHDALLHQQRDQAGERIRELYRKMGRKPPDAAGLEPLLQAAGKVLGDRPKETERISITRPDYTVLVENAKAAGKALISVSTRHGPDGRPARVEFKGDVTTEPERNGADLATRVRAEPEPRTMTSAQAETLRQRLNGRWRDQDGAEYEVSGEGTQIILTELRPGRTNRPYQGTFDLGLIRARFPITRVEDMGDGLPLKVRQQLAGMGLTFDMQLSVTGDGATLDGTWASQHVTYSPDGTVGSVHNPYDLALTLTRGGMHRVEAAAADARP